MGTLGEVMNEKPQCKVFPDGTKEWSLNGERHRSDGPALEWTDGNKEWWFNGERHRTDGPALECANGTKAWWFCGKRHRIDGPALEGANVNKQWWFNGKLLGFEDEGFWALWELLTPEERSDWKLLQWAPWVKS